MYVFYFCRRYRHLKPFWQQVGLFVIRCVFRIEYFGEVWQEGLYSSQPALSSFFYRLYFPFSRLISKRLFWRSRHLFYEQVFENFLSFLKHSYFVDGLHFFYSAVRFIQFLPYRLHSLRRSNRSYLFPAPIGSELTYRKYIVGLFRVELAQQQLLHNYSNLFFQELLAFFGGHPDSSVGRYRENVISLGLENRAYVHYRWRMDNRG